MAYPDGTAYPITELLIGTTWTDYSHRHRAPGGTTGVSITRGRSNEQGRVTPQSSAFALNTADGLFSTRNPNSPLFGMLPRNTQVRHRAGDGDNHIFIPWNDQVGFNGVATPDKAALDITGDIEIRADIWPHWWTWPNNSGIGVLSVLASKWASGSNQRSWVLYLQSDGRLGFGWTTDGTLATLKTVVSSVAVPLTSNRLSVKITLDVNNGASGYTGTFSTSATVNGTYTTLGAAQTAAGVTSIFASTASLCIGIGADVPSVFSSSYTFGGKFYELQVRNGIAGTLVADAVGGAVALGAASFTDAQSNLWTMFNKARIISDRMRYVGELSLPALTWDQTGRDVYTTVSSTGLMSRLQANGQALGSAMFRQFRQLPGLVGYWPLEDSAGAQTAVSTVAGSMPGQLGTVTMGGTDQAGLPGASSFLAFGDPTLGPQLLAKPVFATTTQTITYMYYVRTDSLPPSDSTISQFYVTGGTIRRVDLTLAAGGGSWKIDLFAADGSVLDSSGFVPFGSPSNDPTQNWVGLNFLAQASGGTISWYFRWLQVNPAVNTFTGIGPQTFSGSIGSWDLARLTSKNSAGVAGMKVSHLVMANQDIGFVGPTVLRAAKAYVGEQAADRIDRLGTEEKVATEIIGQWDRTELMGPQLSDTWTNLVQECADSDRGMLGESRSMLAVTYRCGADLESRRDLTIDYSAAQLTNITVSEDGQGFQNDVTVSRKNGSSSRKTIAATGYKQLGTAAPPAGAGVVSGGGPSGGSYSLQADTQLDDLAGWAAHVGSWDDARYPNMTISLHRAEVAAIAEQVRGLDLGDTAQIINPPNFLPPEPILTLTQGYTETLTHSMWDVAVNNSSAGPYRTGVYDQPDEVGTPRWTTSGSTVSTAVNTTATTLILAYAVTGDFWTITSASYPFDLMIEGERIRLNSPPGGTTSPQTFTGVTRSVNGIVKAHGVGAPAELFDTTYYGA